MRLISRNSTLPDSLTVAALINSVKSTPHAIALPNACGLSSAQRLRGCHRMARRELQPPLAQPEARKRVVLIVEDEAYARRALCRLLRLCGYLAEAVGSAEEALRVIDDLADHPEDLPDVALVDYHLPGLNGIDFITEMRRIRPRIVPILITAAKESEMFPTRKAVDIALLAKPLELAELLRMLPDVPLNRND